MYCASSHNQNKDNNKFENKKQPELTKLNCFHLTTKELKKKHSTRPTGGVEMGNQVGRTCSKMVMRRPGWVRQQLADQVRRWVWDQAVPHLRADKP